MNNYMIGILIVSNIGVILFTSIVIEGLCRHIHKIQYELEQIRKQIRRAM